MLNEHFSRSILSNLKAFLPQTLRKPAYLFLTLPVVAALGWNSPEKENAKQQAKCCPSQKAQVTTTERATPEKPKIIDPLFDELLSSNLLNHAGHLDPFGKLLYLQAGGVFDEPPAQPASPDSLTKLPDSPCGS